MAVTGDSEFVESSYRSALSMTRWLPT